MQEKLAVSLDFLERYILNSIGGFPMLDKADSIMFAWTWLVDRRFPNFLIASGKVVSAR